ncbi:hypothetical protein Agub_g14395, partial [Astrephomene gubernaculifera]
MAVELSGQVTFRRPLSKRLVFFDLACYHGAEGQRSWIELLVKADGPLSLQDVRAIRDDVKLGDEVRVRGVYERHATTSNGANGNGNGGSCVASGGNSNDNNSQNADTSTKRGMCTRTRPSCRNQLPEVVCRLLLPLLPPLATRPRVSQRLNQGRIAMTPPLPQHMPPSSPPPTTHCPHPLQRLPHPRLPPPHAPLPYDRPFASTGLPPVAVP